MSYTPTAMLFYGSQITESHVLKRAPSRKADHCGMPMDTTFSRCPFCGASLAYEVITYFEWIPTKVMEKIRKGHDWDSAFRETLWGKAADIFVFMSVGEDAKEAHYLGTSLASMCYDSEAVLSVELDPIKMEQVKRTLGAIGLTPSLMLIGK